MIPRSARAPIVMILLGLAAACQSQAGATSDAVSLVKGFYDWYVPTALAGKGSWSEAFGGKTPLFAPMLAKALQDDIDAQSKVRGEIIGLDFDPFLDAQDPCEAYEMGRATSTGNSVTVEVFEICQGKKRKKPDVIIEVVRRNNRSVIADIRYPDGDTLLKVLESLRKERKQ